MERKALFLLGLQTNQTPTDDGGTLRAMPDESVTKSVPTARLLPLSVTRPAYSLWWHDEVGEHRHPLDGTATIGSSTSNPIVVTERTVSRIHAQIEVRANGVWIRDLNSKYVQFEVM